MRTVAFLPLAVALLAPAPAFAAPQDTPPRVRPEPSAQLPEQFSSAVGLVELADGRVLFSDVRERTLYLGDFARRSVQSVARTGSGPTEYKMAGGFYPQRSGEFWMIDRESRRHLRFDARGTPLGTVPFADLGAALTMNSTFADPHVLDGRGREYSSGRAIGPDGAGRDTVPLVRRDSAGAVDTLLWLKVPKPEVTRMGMVVQSVAPRFAPADGFAVGVDGRIALVTAQPYRVTWISPEGVRREGPTIAYTPVPTTDADREAVAAERRASPAPSLRVNDAQGRPINIGNLAAGAGILLPSHKGPIDPTQVKVAPDGRVWVRRYGPAGALPVYDVFDATGARVDRIHLKAREQLVGVGKAAMYIAVADADDVLTVHKVVL